MSKSDDTILELLKQGKHGIKHFAIIPDGNRRWAKQRGLEPYEGHKRAVKVLEDILPIFGDLHIPVVTIWAFSTENWKRPKKEVQVLFNLLKGLAKLADKQLNKHGIRLKVIGRRDRFSNDLLQAIEQAEVITQANNKFTLVIPLDYGGRDEIRRAFLKILTQIKVGKLQLDDVIDKLLEQPSAIEFIDSFMDTADLPYPDVILRTSGEKRLSGLYVWQNAYAELFFLQKYFPDITKQDIVDVVKEFMHRNRRFGGN